VKFSARFAGASVDGLMVVGQIGQSLDGRIATESGHSKYINGPAGLTHLHRLRALVDAVVIGVGTAIADDPQLTVRRVAGRSRPASSSTRTVASVARRGSLTRTVPVASW
jgi:riboflavin biosynthesis pyrimidine reductase